MNENKSEVRYIDMTPTWLSVLPILVESYHHPDSRAELERMAKLADRLKGLEDKIKAAAEKIDSGIVEQFNNWVRGTDAQPIEKGEFTADIQDEILSIFA